MGKIKLTESQIEMLQSFEDQLPSKKVIKLTSEQYNRIFESDNGFEFKMPPKATRPSTKVTKNFKQGGKTIPDSKIKFETIVNKEGPADIMFFGQQVIRFLKRLLTDPSDGRINKFWRDLDVSREDLIKKMFELGMIGHGIINGKKIFKIMKNKFHDNVKTLHKEYVPQNEGITQMGNDIELEEDNLPLGADMDSNAPFNDREAPEGKRPEQRVFDLLWYHKEHAIFEKDGKYFLFDVDGDGNRDYGMYANREETPTGREDGVMNVEYGDFEMNGEVVDAYVNDNYRELTYGVGFDDFERGRGDIVEMDQEMIDDLLSSSKYIKNPKDREELITVLSNLTLGETTTAASSGAFVGSMSMGAPITGVGPAEEMKNIVGEIEDDNEANEKLSELKYNNFQHPTLGIFHIKGVDHKNDDEKKLTYSISLTKGDDGKKSNSELLYIFDKKTGKDKLIFNHGSEVVRDAYEVFDELYALVFDGVKEALKPNDGVDETTTAASSGAYVTPKIWAKDKDNMRFGKETMYPDGEVVDPTIKEGTPSGMVITESQYNMLIETAGDNQKDTAYPEGGFVELDDCTKLNNNKDAENGGCSTGAVDNVVKVKQSKNSVVSDDALYYEVAKKTGKTIGEVKKIILRRKG